MPLRRSRSSISISLPSIRTVAMDGLLCFELPIVAACCFRGRQTCRRAIRCLLMCRRMLQRRHGSRFHVAGGVGALDIVFELAAELADGVLHGPGGAVCQSA